MESLKRLFGLNKRGDRALVAVQGVLDLMRLGEKRIYLVASTDVNGKYMGDDEVAEIAKELGTNTTLTTLDLVGHRISAAGCAALASAVESPHSVLTTLNLTNSRVDDAGCAALASAIQSPHTALTVLHLVGNHIGDDGCAALAAAIKSPASALTTLNLYGNRIGDEGCVALAAAIQSAHSKLTVLNLSLNRIGDGGCVALATAIQFPGGALTALHLSSNRVGDDGCAALAIAVQSAHGTLTQLALYKNCVGNKGASCLVASLAIDTSLLHIDLRENAGIAAPVRARIITLVQLSRDGVSDVPRRLVAELSDNLFNRQISFATYRGEGGWDFEYITDFAPILSALRELAHGA